jgi:predicted nicotinamide N-methyase
MMQPILNIQSFAFGTLNIELFVPDSEAVRKGYEQEKIRNPEAPFPFWAKVWPSALAMAEYLQLHPDIITGKNVLELASGLGLPSIVAAHYAEKVCCSDYLELAVDLARQNVLHNRLSNVDCRVYNWNDLPDDLSADILLMSDVNYEPADFDQLIAVCKKFLFRRTTIIITTPGRMMAKEFVNRLDTWCVEKSEIPANADTIIFLYKLCL